jgi:drug/metabolite transporter (DMT)-like permease
MLPYLALTMGAALWGGSYLATQVAVAHFPPILFALGRFIIATSTMYGVVLYTKTPLKIPANKIIPLTMASFCGFTLLYVLENTALKLTSSANAALIMASSPIVTIMGAVILYGERPRLAQLLGTVMALTAMCCLIGGNISQTGIGDGLMLLNMLVEVVYILIAKQLSTEIPLIAVLFWNFLIGLVGLVPFVGLEFILSHPVMAVDTQVLFSALYLGIGSSCLGYGLWLFGLKHLSTTTVGTWMYLAPVFTIIFSSVLLHRSLDLWQSIEAIFILGGVYLASQEKQKN